MNPLSSSNYMSVVEGMLWMYCSNSTNAKDCKSDHMTKKNKLYKEGKNNKEATVPVLPEHATDCDCRTTLPSYCTITHTIISMISDRVGIAYFTPS